MGAGFNTIVYNTTNFGNDVINSFDSAGGSPANQDRIDLSGLWATAANFANRVFRVGRRTGQHRIITIRENGAASAIQGTIQINGSNTAAIDITDFTLATGTVLAGATAGNDTLNGTAGGDIINALAGTDTVNGNGGNDTLSGGLSAAAVNFADNFEAAEPGQLQRDFRLGPRLGRNR